MFDIELRSIVLILLQSSVGSCVMKSQSTLASLSLPNVLVGTARNVTMASFRIRTIQ